VAKYKLRDEENGGIFAPDDTDVWSAEEILKAAHKFMANGGTVNKEHEDILLGTDLAPYGQLVENAVALSDITIDTPDGEQVIKQGSWYIGVQPTADGKAAIESGEFGGVSIQGTAVKDLIATSRPGSRSPRPWTTSARASSRPTSRGSWTRRCGTSATSSGPPCTARTCPTRPASSTSRSTSSRPG
jgi:hypothetical protein